MKKIILSLITLVAIGSIIPSCDKVEFPNIPISGVDTTLYPGSFSEYTIPTFSENTNTFRNVMIEDFTGHKCPACPAAADIAKGLEDANPGRVFVASIHGGPSNNGITEFQKTSASFPTDFTTLEGTTIASTFFQLGIGFVGNPRGAINRISNESGEFMFSQSFWVAKTNYALTTPLTLNLQAKSNYYPETNGVFLHAESDFETSMTGDFNIAVYAIENKRIAPQIVGVDEVDDYEHHNIHRGNVFGETWGRSIASGEINAGTKVVTNFSYKLPDELTNESMHFLIYVYDKSTYEILQVIKHEF